MHIRFLHYGTGDPHRAVSYLLAAKDHNGRVRPEVTVLRGNPSHLASLAASLSTVHRYTSLVIAWAPEDRPTSREIGAVLNDFERLAFAGMESNQYCHTAISHGDHVHILVAKVDLQTGKSMNIAPPIWRKHFDFLRDFWNHQMGWGRPDDPNRARLVQADGDRLKHDTSALAEAERISEELGFAVSDVLGSKGYEPRPKQRITDHLTRLVLEGQVKNRSDVLAELVRFGAIHRAGDDYISIKVDGEAKSMRFKGSIFHRDFDVTAAARQLEKAASVCRAAPDLQAAHAAKSELDKAIARRVRYYEGRSSAPMPVPLRMPNEHDVLAEPTSTNTKEQDDERNRNYFLIHAHRAFIAARTAIEGFIRSCDAAVSRLGTAERSTATFRLAGSDAQQASHAAQRASDLVDRALVHLNATSRHAPGTGMKPGTE